MLVRPAVVARRARAAADRRGKPLLNIGAGTPRSSLRVALFGPTGWGDVNLDLASIEGVCLPVGTERQLDRVCQGDAMILPYADREFGAVIASHVLEHLSDVQAALDEWTRVADEVFVIVPWWWTPHAWLHPGHQVVFFGGRPLRIRGRNVTGPHLR